MEKIKVGFIGLGARGKVLLKNILKNFEEIEVVALCDVYADRVEDCQNLIFEKRNVKAVGYSNYEDVLKDEQVNTVIISASWEAHIPLAIASLKAGKATGLEVGGAYSIDDCWALVRTYQRTKTPFMFLENCCYGKAELLATSLARNGIFGKVVYCHGAYRHDLRPQIASGEKLRHYRLRNYLMRNCDNYPTHNVGPIAKLLNINRGNRMISLVSIASKACGMKDFIEGNEEHAALKDKTFMQGDVVQTLITCADGTLISLKLDTTLPHPYSREFTVEGTKGFYQEMGNIVYEDKDKMSLGEDMNLYVNTADKYSEYLPSMWSELTEEEIKAGHGGMDTLLLRDFFNALLENREPSIDVYDAAAWMAISCLTEESIKCGGKQMSIPDFTGGEWILREPKDVVELPRK